MRNQKKIIIIAIVLILGIYGLLVFDIPYRNTDNNNQKTISASDMIKITSLRAGDSINSPATFSGLARGNWFFEASFPIKIIAVDGSVLGQGIAQALGDWMTEDFVEWKASVSFDIKDNTVGFVKFMRDNPSGMPENDMSIEVPVMFIKNN